MMDGDAERLDTRDYVDEADDDIILPKRKLDATIPPKRPSSW